MARPQPAIQPPVGISLGRLTLVAITLFALVTSRPGAAQDAALTPLRQPIAAEDLRALLGSFMPEQLKRTGIPGAAVVVVEHGRIVLAQGYGLADIATGWPMTADRSLVYAASVKKVFEGVAIMQMVEQGRLSLDSDVNAYLDFSIPTPPGGVPVTLRRLMTHRAGFENRFKSGDGSFAQTLPTRIFPDGDVPAYSNYGAALTGYVLGRVAREPTGDYIGRRILAPLDMGSSAFSVRPPPLLAPLMAVGYQVSAAKPVRQDEDFTDLQLYTTAADMGRFIEMVLDGGMLDGHRILRTDSMTAMLTRQFSTPLPGIGLFFTERDVGGVRFIGHMGDTSAFQTDLLFQPQAGFGLFVAYNGEDRGDARGLLERALVERYFTAAPDTTAFFTSRAADAATAAGWYERTRNEAGSLFYIEHLLNQMRVQAKADGSLAIDNAGFFPAQFKPFLAREIAPSVYRDDDGRKWVFGASQSGKEILEYADGVSARDRVAWYRAANFVQPLMAASLAIMSLTLLAWPFAAVLRRWRGIGVLGAVAVRRRYLFVRLALCLDLAVAVAVILLLRADWDNRQIFNDALDSLLWGLFAMAWLGVAAGAAVAWVALGFWRDAIGGYWMRVHHSLIAVAALAAAWFAVVWHVAGTSVIY